VIDLLVGDKVGFTGAAFGALGLKLFSDALMALSETLELVAACNSENILADRVALDAGGMIASNISAAEQSARANAALNQNLESNVENPGRKFTGRLDIVSSRAAVFKCRWLGI
jgi:hypothetical protein